MTWDYFHLLTRRSSASSTDCDLCLPNRPRPAGRRARALQRATCATAHLPKVPFDLHALSSLIVVRPRINKDLTAKINRPFSIHNLCLTPGIVRFDEWQTFPCKKALLAGIERKILIGIQRRKTPWQCLGFKHHKLLFCRCKYFFFFLWVICLNDLALFQYYIGFGNDKQMTKIFRSIKKNYARMAF